VLQIRLPYSTSITLRARATHACMLLWDLRCPNNAAEIVRIVLIVALLTRHGTVPGALGRMEPDTKSKRTKLCDKSKASVAVWARDALAVLLLQVRNHLCPVGLLPMGSDISIFLWDRCKMTYDDRCKLAVNPMDTKVPRICLILHYGPLRKKCEAPWATACMEKK